MNRFGILAVLIFFFLVYTASASTVTGIVFEDQNGNGTRDKGEPGIARVPVSNQHEVVLTDEDGRYHLPVYDPMVVFVTQPEGYRVPVDGNNLPQFYYIHDPDGSDSSVDWRFKPVEPTGKLPESVDFPLLRHEHPAKFKMIALADPQPSNDRKIDFVRDDVVSELVNADAALAIVHGDIMFDDLSFYDRQNRLFATMGVPVWNVPGNHDINFESPDDKQSLETWKRIFGPTYFSHNLGDVHFVTLENIHYKGRAAKPGRRGGGYTGRIGEEQLAWLANDLKVVPDDKLIVISTHIPIKAFQEGDEHGPATEDRERLFELLEGRNHLLLLAGHTHTNDHLYLGDEDGWYGDEPLHQHVLATISGTWWQGPIDDRGIPVATMRDGTDNGYTIITFDGNQYASRFKAAGKDDDYQVRVVLDTEYHNDEYHGLSYTMMGEQGSVIRSEQIYNTRVVANVFSAGEKARVMMRVDGGEPIQMKHTRRYDPFFAEMKARQELRGPHEQAFWGESLSSHVWQVDLPQGLEPGVHVVEVTAIDQFGQKLTGRKVFEVVAP